MVQAQSLARLIDLADEPPLEYSQGDTSNLGGPLTLYIARVPGSRDVLFSTIKPLDKIVRAEDVQSCLYYVHVDSPDDDSMIGPTEGGPADDVLPPARALAVERGDVRGDVRALKRKPLPQRVHDPTTQAPSSLHHSVPNTQSTVRDTRTTKILGPRPIKPPLRTPDPVVLDDVTSRQNLDGRLSIEKPQLKKNMDVYEMKMQQLEKTYAANAAVIQSCHGTEANVVQDAAGHSSSNPVRTQTSRTHLGASLTIIRRYDGKQSNVGKIYSGTDLEILNQGYLKYMNHRDQEGVPGICGQQGNPPKTPHNFQTALMPTPQVQGLKRESLHASEVYTNQDTGRPIATAGSQSQRFAFSTPWRRRCEFLTGVAGRSLKCRSEAYPGARSSFLTPKLYEVPGERDMGETAGRVKRRSLAFRKSIDLGSLPPEGAGLSEVSTAASDEELEVPSLDLSLGQEHAGGGFGGKQAKLGKLIVAPEGVQMLDLLVTANVAMWWKVYEKVW